MNKLDVNSILNQLKTHLATIPDDDETPATVENVGTTAEVATPTTTSTPPNVTADNGNNTVTTEQGAATLTTPAPVTTSPAQKSKFVCIVETNDGNCKPRNLPADTNSFSIENVSFGDGEEPPFSITATIVFIEDSAGTIVSKLIPPVTKKFTVTKKQIVIETLDGENIPYDLPATDIKSIKVEKFYSLPLPDIDTAPAPKARIVIETDSGTPERYSLPPDTRKIIFEKLNVSNIELAADEELDFLEYTLKIFETTDYELLDEDEGDDTGEGNNTAAVETVPDLSGVELQTATLAQINFWHACGGVVYFQSFLRKYGLDHFVPYRNSLYSKYRIGFDEGKEGGSGRGIFPIDDTRYYSILFKCARPVDAELAEKTLLAFKLADKKPARGMEDIQAEFCF